LGIACISGLVQGITAILKANLKGDLYKIDLAQFNIKFFHPTPNEEKIAKNYVSETTVFNINPAKACKIGKIKISR